MGQKVSPIGLRVGVIRDWDARWYANDKDFATLLHEDLKIRDYINNKFKRASVSRVEIERAKNRVNIIVHTAKPGMVIGRGGSEKDAAVAQLEKMTGKRVFIRIVEIKRPEVDAQKVAIQRAIKFGAKGIKTQVSGRLGGADMARAEGYSEGNVPLHTLRADIDYATAEADTTYGKLGIKVWIYKGEVLPTKNRQVAKEGK